MRYDYQCNSCEAIYEIDHKFNETKKKCYLCGKLKLEKIFLEAPLAFVRQEATTVGQLAERKDKELGKYGLEEARRRLKENNKIAEREKRQEVQSKLPSGVTLVEPGNTKSDLPENVKKAIRTGDNTTVKNYIKNGG